MSCENNKNNNVSELAFVDIVNKYKNVIPDDIKELLAGIGTSIGILMSHELSEDETLGVISECQETISILQETFTHLVFIIGQEYPDNDE